MNIECAIGRISPYAFGECTSLTSICIPDNVQLDSVSFFGCTSLKSVFIDKNMTVDSGAFSGCDSLTEIKVDENNEVYHSDGNCIIRTADNVLLQGCNTSVIPDYVTKISDFAFYGCASLKSVTIPDSVREIELDAFRDCRALTNINIPSSVKIIGKDAFRGCESLTSVTIHKNVKEIGIGAFSDCDSLTEIKVDENNKVYHSDGNCIIKTADNVLLQGCNTSTIPSYVTSIEDSAFSGCASLSSLDVPDNILSIGNDAFANCESLTSVFIHKDVKEIGTGAFSNCNSLVEIKVDKDNPTFHSDRNTIILTENNALLQGCNTSTIPSYVTIICLKAFSNCRSLKSVVIPKNVGISGMAFDGCESLADIRYEGSVRRWNEEVFLGAYPFRNVATDVIHCKNGDVEIYD